MRQQAWEEVKIVLNDYPRYDWYINQILNERLNPWRPSDENVGGGKSSSSDNSKLERVVVSIADDMTLRKLEFQRNMVKRKLDRSPEWLKELIAYMHFGTEKMALRPASELVGKSWRLAKKEYSNFMEELAGELGIIRF